MDEWEQQKLARFPSHPEVVLILPRQIDRNCNFEEPINVIECSLNKAGNCSQKYYIVVAVENGTAHHPRVNIWKARHFETQQSPPNIPCDLKIWDAFHSTTGSPSFSCEIIILRSISHGGIIRVCMGIFMTALRNKKIRQILNKNTSPYFHSISLVIWPLTLIKRTHFSEFSISRFSWYVRRKRKFRKFWTGDFRWMESALS